MKKVRIINMDGLSSNSKSDGFERFGLKIGDEIEVSSFTGNAVWYQPIKGGDVLIIYSWNVEEVKDLGMTSSECLSFLKDKGDFLKTSKGVDFFCSKEGKKLYCPKNEERDDWLNRLVNFYKKG